MRIVVALGLLSLIATPAFAKGKKAAAPPKQASAQTARAISDLMGKFKWDMSSEDAMKIISDDLTAKFDARLRAEKLPAKQDVILREKNDALTKLKESYVKFDGQKTGWDVSIIDREFSHHNDESMFYYFEPNAALRRFFFFHDNRLWKQFIAFNAENQAFAGKSFDDFADIIQAKYGPAAMTFRKQRTSDEQTFDHLEWPPSGDYVLWAIDLTTFYGNFCLSLMRKSKMAMMEKSRAQHNPAAHKSALVEQVTNGESSSGDANADVVDQITGRTTTHRDEQPTQTAHDTGSSSPKPDTKRKPTPSETKSEDPLEGLKL
jgi:hypothetical protein